MKKKNSHLIQTNEMLEDQEAEVKKFYVIILIILSGIILYSDKVLNYFNIGSDIDFKYYNNLESFIWHISQTISPILILCALALYIKDKFIKFALLTPLSAYSIQAMYIMADENYIENDYFVYYTLAFIIMQIFCFYLLQFSIQNYAYKISELKTNIKVLINLVLRFKTKSINVNNSEEVNENIYNVLRKVASDE